MLNNPIKYNDPSGHCALCIVGVLGIFYAGGRAAWEVTGVLFDDQARRDGVGGQYISDHWDAIENSSIYSGIDPILTAAVLRHESSAIERAMLTILPNQQPGLIANTAEIAQVRLRGFGASVGPGQMQLQRAIQLEEAGFVRKRGGADQTLMALLNDDTATEYVAGELSYIRSQLTQVEGYGGLSVEEQYRLVLIGYNQGWEILEENIRLLGFQELINRSQYDNETLDELLRWAEENAN